MLLEVKNLHASINNTEILKGINLEIKPGEVHVIMGLNGSGKSTFSKVLAGHPSYKVNSGQIIFENEDITYLDPEERALKGLFLAFQYPVEVPGVSNEEFLRTAYNLRRSYNELPNLDPLEFFNLLNDKTKAINLKMDFVARNVNEGFSGGEKKRNEIFQLITLDSKFCILDEIDSGLDIDALKNISDSINNFLKPDKGLLIITHYKRLLNYIKPDFVHVMKEGKIVQTGDIRLASELEQYGYDLVEK